MFIPRPVSESEAVEALLRQLGAELRDLAAQIARFAAELEQRPPRPAIPLRPWWDAPVRGLPLEEALKAYGESRPE